jgi:hypothetical protein
MIFFHLLSFVSLKDSSTETSVSEWQGNVIPTIGCHSDGRMSFRRQEESLSRIGFRFTERFLYRDFGIRMTRGSQAPFRMTGECHSDGRRNLSFTYWVWFTERFFTPQAPFRMTRGSQAPFRMTRGLSFRRQEESLSHVLGFGSPKDSSTETSVSEWQGNVIPTAGGIFLTYWGSVHWEILHFAGSVQNDKGGLVCWEIF